MEIKLFKNEVGKNLLPFDGIVEYHGIVLRPDQSEYYFTKLMDTVEWKNDETIIFGRHFVTKRKTAWYGDQDYLYTYSNTTKKALPWTAELFELKKIAEACSGSGYNSCLLNLYHSGDEGMSWHSDDERALKENAAIASLSLGAERRFALRHKQTGEKISCLLENGSLLVMKDATQKNWVHALPKSKKITKPRINLTFRTVVTG